MVTELSVAYQQTSIHAFLFGSSRLCWKATRYGRNEVTFLDSVFVRSSEDTLRAVISSLLRKFTFEFADGFDAEVYNNAWKS
jgi:hypothetical protein